LGNKHISARNHHRKKAAEPGKLDWRVALAVVGLFGSLAMLCGCHAGARQARAQTPTMPERDINAVLRAHDKELLATPGVVGVYVGVLADEKTSCLKVMVVKKTKGLEEAIPKSMEGYPVELEETGVIRPMRPPH
jgi:hypothetical protein